MIRRLLDRFSWPSTPVVNDYSNGSGTMLGTTLAGYSDSDPESISGPDVNLYNGTVQASTPWQPLEPAAVTVYDVEGRVLLAVHMDGRVTGTAEDASEAAAIFVHTLRDILGGNGKVA